jgi:hypothetical protein
MPPQIRIRNPTINRSNNMTETPNEKKIGTEMPDGTLYAGVSQKTGKKMYIGVRGSEDKGSLLTIDETQQALKNLAEHGHDYLLRSKQKIFESTAATAAERFNNASMATEQYWTPTENEKAGSTVNASVSLVRPAPKP